MLKIVFAFLLCASIATMEKDPSADKILYNGIEFSNLEELTAKIAKAEIFNWIERNPKFNSAQDLKEEEIIEHFSKVLQNFLEKTKDEFESLDNIYGDEDGYVINGKFKDIENFAGKNSKFTLLMHLEDAEDLETNLKIWGNRISKTKKHVEIADNSIEINYKFCSGVKNFYESDNIHLNRFTQIYKVYEIPLVGHFLKLPIFKFGLCVIAINQVLPLTDLTIKNENKPVIKNSEFFDNLLNLFYQIIDTFSILHTNKKIIHGDLKKINILWNEDKGRFQFVFLESNNFFNTDNFEQLVCKYFKFPYEIDFFKAFIENEPQKIDENKNRVLKSPRNSIFNGRQFFLNTLKDKDIRNPFFLEMPSGELEEDDAGQLKLIIHPSKIYKYRLFERNTELWIRNKSVFDWLTDDNLKSNSVYGLFKFESSKLASILLSHIFKVKDNLDTDSIEFKILNKILTELQKPDNTYLMSNAKEDFKRFLIEATINQEDKNQFLNTNFNLKKKFDLISYDVKLEGQTLFQLCPEFNPVEPVPIIEVENQFEGPQEQEQAVHQGIPMGMDDDRVLI